MLSLDNNGFCFCQIILVSITFFPAVHGEDDFNNFKFLIPFNEGTLLPWWPAGAVSKFHLLKVSMVFLVWFSKG